MTGLIDCACLVAKRDGKVLLVKVRDNKVWYFPGGKIDAGETPVESLARELKEELGLDMHPGDFDHLVTVEGANHDRTAMARLRCYQADINQEINVAAEITDFAWMDVSVDQNIVAPLVLEALRQAR